MTSVVKGREVLLGYKASGYW